MTRKNTDPKKLVEQTCALIDAFEDGTPTLNYLGAALNIGPTHLQRLFKKATGISPRQYAETRRLENFKTNLKAGQSVTASMYDAGFGGTSRLYETANGKLGMTPASYGKGGNPKGGGGKGDIRTIPCRSCGFKWNLVGGTH